MKIRQITETDFDDLYQLWVEAGLQLYPSGDERKRFDSMLNLNPDLCFALINDKKEIIGSILGGFDGRTASIHRLVIHPTLQKQGQGSFLVNELETALRKRGIKKLSAQIHISNTEVVPFYEKLGFQEMTYVKNYYKDL